MSDRKLRLGAVGLGRAFSLMLPTFRAIRASSLSPARTRAQKRARHFVKDFGGKGYASIEELCADPRVEAVYISTPHELHAAQACYAASKASICWSKSRWR